MLFVLHFMRKTLKEKKQSFPAIVPKNPVNKPKVAPVAQIAIL